jgi:hypothetical protein
MMKLSSFLLTNAVLFVPFGLAMLIAPAVLFPLFGIDLDADGILMARVFGSALMNFGLICFLIRNEHEFSVGMKAVLAGNFFFHAFDAGSTFVASFNGVMNILGWMFFGLHFVLAIGFLVYLLRKEQEV